MADENEQSGVNGLSEAAKAAALDAMRLVIGARKPSEDRTYHDTHNDSLGIGGAEEPAAALAKESPGLIGSSATAHHNMWPANNNEKPEVVEMPPMLSGVASAIEMIADIEQNSALQSDPDVAKALKELKAFVDAAIKGSRDAKAPNLSDIATKIGDAKAEVAKGNDKVVDINSLHKDLYVKDALYRAEVDKTMEKSDKETKGFDKEQAKLDAVAAEKGYKTTQDDKRADIEAKIKALENDPAKAHELLQLRIQRLDIIRAQNEERRKQADPETAKQFENHQPIIEEQRKLQMENAEHLKEKMIDAKRRVMKAEGRKAEEIEAAVKQISADFEEFKKSSAQSSAEEISTWIDTAKKTTDRMNSNAETEEKKDKERHTQSSSSYMDSTAFPKYAVAPASPAQPVSPKVVPDQSSSVGTELGSSGF